MTGWIIWNVFSIIENVLNFKCPLTIKAVVLYPIDAIVITLLILVTGPLLHKNIKRYRETSCSLPLFGATFLFTYVLADGIVVLSYLEHMFNKLII